MEKIELIKKVKLITGIISGIYISFLVIMLLVFGHYIKNLLTDTLLNIGALCFFLCIFSIIYIWFHEEENQDKVKNSIRWLCPIRLPKDLEPSLIN